MKRDWRNTLKEYMKRVLAEEGVFYLDVGWSTQELDEETLTALKEVAKEAEAEMGYGSLWRETE